MQVSTKLYVVNQLAR